MEPAHMRKLVLMAIFCSGVLYAPLPLIAQNGGGSTPLIPVADMPADNGGATAPSDPPLEVDPQAAPELVPPQEVGGGAEAPAARPPAPVPTPEPAPTPAPEPAPAPEPTAAVAMPARPAEPAQNPDEPTGDEEPTVPDETPTTTPQPQQDNQDEDQFEEEFDDVPQAGEPNAPNVAPEATAGPQLPRTGGDLPALLVSGLALTASGMSLRALVRTRS
jgi:hypothetical protein